jgi:hypothetical protein
MNPHLETVEDDPERPFSDCSQSSVPEPSPMLCKVSFLHPTVPSVNLTSWQAIVAETVLMGMSRWIDGITGSGKTFLVKQLKERLSSTKQVVTSSTYC